MFRSFLQKSLLAGIALAAAAPAAADVKAGVDAWSRGDYAAAIREWQGPADRGDADAQFNLGQAYKLGRGTPQDLARAEALFAKAAAQGHIQASDNYGLLLFQRGERARAMPYIIAASDRGDARAQYLLGLAYFNGENVVKDWVRAYALVSLAQQSGLSQAVPALAQMDQHIPLAQRQQSVKLARELAANADATRARQLAALDLGAPHSARPSTPVPSMSARLPSAAPPEPKSPVGTGADYTRPKPPAPKIPAVADLMEAAPAPANPAPAKPAPAKPAPAVAAAKPAPVKPVPARPASGVWRVQLGAFGVPGNAEGLWNRVKNRPELAGHAKLFVPEGRLTKVQAGGFASQADAQAACRRLSAAGFICIPARN
jgi:cell division septation protein DedD